MSPTPTVRAGIIETSLFRGSNDLFLVPPGVIEAAQKRIGNGAQATGVAFRPDLDLLDCFRRLATGRDVTLQGTVLQAEMPTSVGWNPLTMDVKPSGVLCKFESTPGKPGASLVLVAAAELTKTQAAAGGQPTNMVTAIAPKIGQQSQLPADVRDNYTVLKALRANQLRSFSDIMPGLSLVHGRRLVPFSAMNVDEDGVVFAVRRDDPGYVSIPGREQKEIAAFVREFNRRSLAAARNDESESSAKLKIRVESAVNAWARRQDARAAKMLQNVQRAQAVVAGNKRQSAAARTA